MEKTISQFKAKNQFIIRKGNNIFFQSYKTIIAKFNTKNNQLTLSEKYDFSRTTIKYLVSFIETIAGIKVNNSKKDLENFVKENNVKIVKELKA